MDGKPIQMTLSIGIAKYPDDATMGERLITRAEEALYQSKARGPNAVGVYYLERRNFIRLDPRTRGLSIQLHTAAGVLQEGATSSPKNISRSGLLVETNRPFEIGECVLVKCQDRQRPDQISLTGRVVRLEELAELAAESRFEVGIAFDLEWEHQEAEVARFLMRDRVGAGE